MSDDLRHHFFSMIGDSCAQASLAQLPVEAVTNDGRRIQGVPEARLARGSRGDDEVDDTGFARDLVIGTETVPLDSIVELRIRLPAAVREV